MQQIKTEIVEIKTDSGKIPAVIATQHYNLARLYPKDILYISRDRNRSKIHVIEEAVHFGFEKKISCKMKLGDLYNILKDYGFEYAHNSYIVNLNYVSRKTPKEIELINGMRLSISRSKDKNFREALIKSFESSQMT